MDKSGIEKLAQRGPLRRSAPVLFVMAGLVIGAVLIRYLVLHQEQSAKRESPLQPNIAPPSAEEQFSSMLLNDGTPDEQFLFEGDGAAFEDSRLQLSREQRERLADLRQGRSHIAELVAIVTGLRRELGVLLFADSSPEQEQEVFDKVNRLNEAIADLHTERVRNVLEVRKILTGSQQKLAAQFLDERRHAAAIKAKQKATVRPSDADAPAEETEVQKGFDEAHDALLSAD